MSEFSINANMPPGPVGKILLHPTNFPGTPYASNCQNFTHRVERSWEIDIEVTTAANTGFRAGVVMLADPQLIDNPLPSGMIWSAVLSGQGAMMTSTGTGRSRQKLRLPMSTIRLSNAAMPPFSTSVVGFSAGYLTVHLLDPPIGITGDSSVRVTVLARVDLTVSGPMSGFMIWSATHEAPGPDPTPSATFTITVKAAATQMPLNNHVASAWLAGGYYLKFPDSPTQMNNAKWDGECWAMAVYTCSHQGVNWQDNYSSSTEPTYYVVWREPGSAVTQLIGFVSYEDAKNQADGHTGMIGGQKELCIIYHGGTSPNWNTRWEGVADNTVLSFNLVHKGGNAWPIWKTAAPGGRRMPTPELGPGGQQGAGRSYWLPGPSSSPAPTTGTQPSSSTQVSTLVTSLTQQLEHCQRVIQTLQTQSQTLQTRYRPSLASLPEGSSVDPQPSTPMWEPGSTTSTPSWVRWWHSLTPPTNDLTQSLNNLQTSDSKPATLLQARSESAPPATNWAMRSPPRVPPSALPSAATIAPGMQVHTGSPRSLSEPVLHECPGCDNPQCADCFTDEEEEEGSIQLPSRIGSVESLVEALSRLGASTV